MTRIDFDRWVKIRAKLDELLELLDSELAREDKELLRDFIENNEYGVAVDWIRSIISERDLSISAQAEDCLDVAEAMMSLDR